ncbi:non-ribosomal peptide synthetase [Amycolatopsis sp. Poz14]|uniref:non-ribosomal peptide synthetase n=1 Tax=Amycolatopsis sp. Poz14 TaxID=1447705 RepID=UPI001EE93390|nr:non-ribosomal peptide synthetase [Amycolatopsis sp. Poz14]MCG3754386.1 amino acid adenylation domain-containing protein [Amycolatopsis sp. Poz14]
MTGQHARIERIYPLSPLQQGMVFHALYEPGKDPYVEQVCCTLTGELDAAAFRDAWAKVMDRHAALRTAFRWTGQAQARQVVHRQIALPWTESDLAGLGAHEQAAAVADLAERDWARGFDLARAPLFRLTLARLGEREHRLVWTNHHAVLDGWSRSRVFGEVMTLYGAAVAGRDAELAPAPAFGDYIAWYQGLDLAQAEKFWRDTLSGFSAATPLPFGTAEAREGTGSVRLDLSESGTAALRALGPSHGFTANTLVQAAWTLLLARHSGQSDVLFGATVAGRPPGLARVEDMVGLFINTVPVRVRATGESVAEWLGDLQRAFVELRQYEHTPLAETRRWAELPGNSPLFESLVVFENYPLDEHTAGSPRVAGVSFREQTHYPLTLVSALADRLTLRLAYARNQYDEAGASGLLAELKDLLAALVANLDAPVAALAALAPEREAALLASWNPAPAAVSADEGTLVERFLRQARERPDAIAVVWGGEQFTYRAVARRAAGLAEQLRSAGVGREVLTGVLVDRGPQQVIALLACHLAGGAYVPLDPEYPRKRLDYLVSDSQIPTLISTVDLADRIPDGPAVVFLAGTEADPAPPRIDPADLAYVIYTSGSTGEPKGVLVPHRNAARLFDATRSWFGFDAGDVWSLFHSVAFDFSVWELWGALAHGGRLVLVDDLTRRTPAEFACLADRQAVTVLNQTPSAFLPLTEVAGDLPSLRTVVFGGEALAADRLSHWAGLHDLDRPRLVNMYGITETTVHVTGHPVGAADLDPAAGSVIGRPIPDLRVYLLDENLRPVPAGRTGELHVGGAGPARGYLRRPGLTAQRFLPDPYGPAGTRMYRTGDLARALPDGTFVYLGRADDQIQVRGHRVEPAEIEAALRAHPHVTGAHVRLRDDQLVAYLTAGGEVGDLREHLARRLPRHLFPAHCVVVDEFPLTVHGKIDPAALPEPGRERSGVETAAPRTPVQEVVAGVWQQLLGVENVGIHDDFFALGGHSLIAAQVHARLRAVFGVDVPLRVLFAHPTVAELAEHVEARRGTTADQRPPLRAQDRPADVPLSFAQQRAWFFEQWAPDSPLNTIIAGLRLTGVLDVAAVAAGLTVIAARHEPLRTAFGTGAPSQVISPPAPVPLPAVDLRGLDPARTAAVVRELAASEARLRFDLQAGPLARARLLRLAEDDHVLLLGLHHTIADGRSLEVLLAELTELYTALREHREPVLPELPFQYADYTLWQRSWLDSATLERQLAHWRENLAGAPALLELPTDRPRPAELGFDGASHAFTVPEPVRQMLHQVSREIGATPFMTLLAAFSLVLSRYSGQDDIVVGTPIGQRPTEEAERLIGFFTNTLALRTDLSGNPTFAQLVARVREGCLDAYANQDVPFEQLVEELRPARDASYAPLAQVGCDYQRVSSPELGWPGVRVRPLDPPPGNGTAKFDLALALVESPDSLTGTLIYNTALFEPATVERIAVVLLDALAALTTEPNRRLRDAPLLSPADHDLLTRRWNHTPAPAAPALGFADLVAAQAKRSPDAVAVAMGGHQLTYAALDARATRLAQHLRAAGAGPDVRVAVCLERCPELVISVLGIMKAGAAYVPLDPTYPADRLAYLVQDSRAQLLLSQRDLLDRLPRHENVLLLDEQWPAIRAERDDTPLPPVPLDAVAYVIYTSGSTGRPKGTMVPHRGIAALADAQAGALEVGNGSRVLQYASLSFDASLLELVMALPSGATLCLAPRERPLPGPDLVQLLDEQAVTTVMLPPSALAVTPDAALPALTTVTVGGEACSADLVRRWAPGRRFHNLYGPTEATICTVMAECLPGALVAIGRPIPGSTAYVLDAELRPAPIGVPGELCLGGDGLAHGYLGRPGLTADRFVPDPFGPPGARLYRTGDRVRFRADGTLAFLGRLDAQVKLRGFRIEPGEIEAALRSVPDVADAAVVLREDQPGAPRLVGYAVANTGVTTDELRAACARDLPEYMVPAAFVVLDEFPSLPSGKLDRGALPAPGADRPELAVSYSAPSTRTERTIADIWAKALGLDRVGRDDDFFALGGDSILSIQVITQAAKTGLRISHKMLFQNRTVRALASAVEEAAPAAAGSGAQDAVSGPVRPTPIQQWFLDQHLPTPEHYNQALLVRPRRPLHTEALRAALREVVAHHDVLRLRVTSGTTLDIAALSDAAPVQLTVAGPADAETIAETAAEAHAGIDLSAGCLLRAVHIRLADSERLLLVAHHLAVDGVSWRILLEDLATAYHQALRGAPLALPAKTTAFRDWAAGLAEHANHPEISVQIPYWTDVLVDARTPALPTDADLDPAGDTYAAAGSATAELDATATEDLLRSSGPASAHELLLTALGRALCDWTGSDRAVVDVESHGREALSGMAGTADLTRTVGWFTAIYPLVLPVTGPPRTAVRNVREAIRALPDGGLGYGLLRHGRSDAATERLRALPGPEVCFNYLGQVDQSFAGDSPWLPAEEDTGPGQSPDVPRRYLIDVVALVADGRLRITVTHGALHRRETVAGLLDALRAHLRTLLAAVRSGSGDALVPADFPLADLDQAALDRLAAATDGAVEDVYPLSPMQEGMLFHTVREDGPGSYVVQMAARLTGKVDPRRFHAAWQRVLNRHAALRTSFHWDRLHRPLQVVHHTVPVAVDTVDWRALDRAEQVVRSAEFLAADRERGFSLTRPPLIRLTLLRLADEEWELVWTHHHLLLDGWSMPLVVRELFGWYEALDDDGAPAVPAAPARPYRDYIAWLRDQDPAEEFWRARLGGFAAATPLPARTPGRTGNGYRTAEIRLPEDATERLRQFTRDLGITTSTLVNAVWAVLLGRHSGEEDVVFGVTVAGRPPELPGVESIVGLFINTLPARVRLPRRQPVGEWLRELHQDLLEMQSNAYSPLVRMQACSAVPRGSSLFESIVVFENYPVDEAAGQALTGVEARQVHAVEQTDYPLTFSSAPGPRLLLSLLYDNGRYSADAAEELLAQLRHLLAEFAKHPGRPVGQVSILDDNAHWAVLSQGISPVSPASEERPLHRLAEEHAERTPDAVAVVADDRQLTYRALNARANQLARVLRRHGVGPETRVGLLLDRSPGLLVGLLAVLKAGGAYVPLDPDAPADRNHRLTGDAGIRLLVSDQDLSDAPVPAIPVSAGGSESAENLPGTTLPDSLAYVVHTSGSTGRPKGVQVSHRNLSAAAAAWRTAYALSEEDRHLQMAGVTFDVFTGDVTRALSSGAALVLCPRELLLDPAALARLLDEQQITAAEFVPVVLRHAVEAVQSSGGRLPALRLLVSGADAWPARDRAAAARIGGERTRVINSYGVTEATVDSTCFDGELTEAGDALVPVGRPLGATRVYVLDRSGAPAPLGAPGELHLGGPQVARGYAGLPGLTAERFVPDPWGGPGDRLYRTGDRARWRPDGELEFLGRLDEQVKLRGVRIEPGEVEAALAAHPAVRAAAVAVRADARGEPRLAGYVVADRDDALLAEVRATAAQLLPASMMPSVLVVLDALPLTANGKLDRSALPAPEAPEATEDYDPPETAAERAIAEVWAKVLGVPRVSATDSFFALGGDSIVSLQVVARTRTAGWAVSPKQVFDHQTVRALAAVAVPASPVSHAEQGVVTGSLPLTPVQATFFAEQHPAPHHYNQAVLLRARGPIDTEALERALRLVVRHHDALRMRFRRTEDGWAQEQAGLSGLPARLLTVEDLAAADDPAAAVEARAAAAQRTLDLDAGLLLRAVWFDLGTDRPGRLLLAVHHLAIDGVSWRILLEDLAHAYTRERDGAPVELPPKTTAFRDWAQALAEHAHSDEVGAQTGHWLSVARAGAESGLPLDLLPEADEGLEDINTRAQLAAVTRELDEETTRLLLHEVPPAYRARIDEVLVTAVSSAIASWAGEPSVLVDLEGHGREDFGAALDVSRTVGWFTSVYPVLLTPDPHDPAAALRHVGQRMREVPQRGLGYGLIRHSRTGDPAAAQLADLPSAAVCFNYLGRLDAGFGGAGPWEPAAEPEGPGQDARAPRPYLLEVDAMVLSGRLRFTWSYSDRLHTEATAAGLADRCAALLRTLVERRRDAEAAGWPAPDVTGVALAPGELDDLLAGFRTP